MKKIISIMLAIVMVLSLTALAGCGVKEGAADTSKPDADKPLKFGMGVYSYIDKVSNADGDTNGSSEAVTTAAAVLVDADGKIVKCVIDTMANKMNFTSEGKFVEAGEFKTKYELGDDYGMKAYGNAPKEWFEQVDAFVKVVEGKTAAQVKALMTGDNKGTDEVVNAGCTIIISDFIHALDKALKNAADSDAKKDNTLKLGFVSAQTGSKDATDEAEGVNEVDTTVVAVALDKSGKVVASATDALQAKVKFDTKGVATTETGAAVTTKKELGKNYGMAQYGNDLNGDGKVKEWDEQGAAFDAALKGKNAKDIAALAIETGYGAQSLQTAGCTIHVGDMVKAAVKAATVA